MTAPDAPVLNFRQQRLLLAFTELSTDRAVGMSEGPIPWSSVQRYADEYGFCLEDLSDVVRMVDGAYLKYQRTKQGAASRGNQKPQVSEPVRVRKANPVARRRGRRARK